MPSVESKNGHDFICFSTREKKQDFFFNFFVSLFPRGGKATSIIIPISRPSTTQGFCPVIDSSSLSTPPSTPKRYFQKNLLEQFGSARLNPTIENLRLRSLHVSTLLCHSLFISPVAGCQPT